MCYILQFCMWESLLGVEAQKNLKQLPLSNDFINSGIGDK